MAETQADLHSIGRSHARRGTIVIISQVYVPDPASVGQHMADVAAELVRRGHRVIVYTSRNGYDDHHVRYRATELIDGTEVRRIPYTSFGKGSMLRRAAGAASFIVHAFLAAFATPRVRGILFTTAPPLLGAAVTLVARLRRVESYYWVMDLNPDQLIALGHVRPRSPTARLLEAANRFALRSATVTIALDRFMADRLLAKGTPADRLSVIAPWAHEDLLTTASEEETRQFRHEHELYGRFVVMYSGNHTRTNPLDTVLNAALAVRDDPRLCFVFVGGGAAKADVEAFAARNRLTNIVSLPYQPLNLVGRSLAAADVHVVTLGERLVGIIHPCKVYGAMAAARPILYVGPRPSHVTELLDQHDVGWHIDHGDTNGLVALLRTLPTRADRLRAMGSNARTAIRARLAQEMLRRELCDRIERGAAPAGISAGAPIG